MSATSTIEWTDATWNPVTGCTKVTPGCDHCYAETFAERWRGTPGHYFEQGFDVVLRPDKLDLPLTWRKPRRVFVNSMSDLFHDQVPDSFIGEVFTRMGCAQQHTFQLLTKRHGRMRSLLNRWSDHSSKGCTCPDDGPCSAPVDVKHGVWPLPNLWLGVSVEDQQRAELRIPALLDTPAIVRWLSCEPLLGPVNLTAYVRHQCDCPPDGHLRQSEYGPRVDWVVVGGESGLRSRPMQVDWARLLRDQCTDAKVPFFFKQWGGRTPKANGRELDGRTWDEYPGGEPR